MSLILVVCSAWYLSTYKKTVVFYQLTKKKNFYLFVCHIRFFNLLIREKNIFISYEIENII